MVRREWVRAESRRADERAGLYLKATRDANSRQAGIGGESGIPGTALSSFFGLVLPIPYPFGLCRLATNTIGGFFRSVARRFLFLPARWHSK